MKPKILLVDDIEINLILLADILEILDIEIYKALSGKEAIELTNKIEFALIILDISMPEMDGYTTLKEIKKNNKNKNLPIIISSGIYNKNNDIINGRNLGAIDFMPKPINSQILIGKVKIHINLFKQKEKLNKTILELEESNKRLKYEQNRMNRLSLLIPEGIILTNKENIITFYNIAAKIIFNFDNNTSEYNNLINFLPNLEAIVPTDINNLSKTNLIISQITKAKKLNGKTFKAEINYTSLQANNTTTNIYVIKDITERQKTEKKLLKAKELKESNQVMKEFMTNMSHELRSPMNAIIGISKMLTKYKSDNLSAKQTEGLKTISESGKRLLDLINDILDLSKLEANKAKVIYESLSIEKLKSTLKSTIISLIGDKPINFLIHASPNVPERIITDHKKLMQILLNLLGNGIKFTEKGKITLNIHCKNNLLFFEVTDTGIGISKKNQKTIFDKFKQIDSSTSRQYKGTGLGLAICKSLTQLLNGEISLESEEGKGTTVRFNILFKEDKEKTKRTITSHLKTKNKNYNALIIDDEESSCFLFKNYLNNNNFNVDIASDGITGINKIIKLQPDLIILSLEIPKLSGYGVMKRLKTESQEIQNIPLILTSISDYIPNNTKYNYDLFLNKPINENTFVLFLKEINSSV